MGWLASLYLLKFSTDVVGLAPALVGALFGAGRIWDALSDPLAGYWSDRTRTAWGRRRPFILAAALPMSVGFVALWTVPSGSSPWLGGAWLGAALLLFYTGQTMFNVPHVALGAELSQDHHDRTRVFATRANFNHAGMLVGIGAFAWVESAAAPRLAMSGASIAMAILSVTLILLAVPRLRERPEYQGRGGSRPLQAARDVWRNPHARRLFPILILTELAFGCMVVSIPFASEHLLRTPGQTSLYLVCAIVPLAFSIPIWAVVSRRIGKKQAWLTGSMLSALGFVSLFFLGEGDIAWIVAGCVWIGFMTGASQALPPSVKADIIDLDELQTGERKEGAYFAAWNLALKAAGGLAVALAGFVLQFSGYAADAPIGQADPAGLRWLMGIFPAFFMALASLLLAGLRYGEAEHRGVREQLSERPSPDSLRVDGQGASQSAGMPELRRAPV